MHIKSATSGNNLWAKKIGESKLRKFFCLPHIKIKYAGTNLEGDCIREAWIMPYELYEDSEPENGPFAYTGGCECGCLWRDNKDGTMSLFGKNSKSCEVCEVLPLAALTPLYLEPKD